MKKTLALVLACVLAISCACVLFVSADEAKTYENTLVEGENGNYTCEVPYGFTWAINYVDGTIAGEDNTIITTQDAYNACNPNWAITVYLEKQDDGTYVALQDAIVTPGSAAAAGITIGEGQIALVAHSSYSNPNGSNWQAKVVAMSVKAGDIFEINEDMTSVYAIIPAAEEAPESSEEAPESSEEAPESSEEAPESSEEAPSEPEVDLKAEYTDSIAALVGEATEDTSFDIVLDSTADAEGVVTVTMTIDNIADGAALTGLYAYLYYDAERMTLTTTANSEGALECLTKLPCDEWAEDNVICAKDGYIDIGIGVTKDPMTAISADAPIVLTFTFQMNEGFEYAGVYATTADASASDKDFNDYYGNGAYEIAELPAEEIESSDDETSAPVTGDAGIVVFAVLAIVAICGAAVVVKVRG